MVDSPTWFASHHAGLLGRLLLTLLILLVLLLASHHAAGLPATSLLLHALA